MCPKRVCISTVGVRKDLYPKDPHNVPITDFFGAIRPTEVSTGRINVTMATDYRIQSVGTTAAGNKKMDIWNTKQYTFTEQFPSHLF